MAARKSIIVLSFGVLALFSILFESCIPSGRDYGKELYMEKCANCHGMEGDGLQQLFPPLKNADYLTDHQNELACIIRYGMEGPIEVNGVKFDMEMPGQPMLSDIDIHNIINYISKNINTNVQEVNMKDMDTQLLDCRPR